MSGYFEAPRVIRDAPADATDEPELVPGHERRLRCIEHHGEVIVGGFVDDIDADYFVCLDCRMRESGLTQE